MADSFKCKKRWAQKDGRASSDTQNMASYGRNRWPVMAGMGGQLRPEWVASYGRNGRPVMAGFCMQKKQQERLPILAIFNGKNFTKVFFKSLVLSDYKSTIDSLGLKGFRRKVIRVNKSRNISCTTRCFD